MEMQKVSKGNCSRRVWPGLVGVARSIRLTLLNCLRDWTSMSLYKCVCGGMGE